MNREIIDELYTNNKSLLEPLLQSGDLTNYKDLEDKLKKILLMSAASYFETALTNGIIEFVEEKSNSNSLLKSFIENKAIKRQYHTLFNWDAANCNTFLGLFGMEFKSKVSEEINDGEAKKWVKDFLELGSLRNQLVHKNVAVFSLEKTSEEIYDLFNNAHKFMDFILIKLKSFNQ